MPDIGSVVVSYSHVIRLSLSALVVKEGTMALSYFGHISIHFTHSEVCVGNFTLDISVLEEARIEIEICENKLPATKLFRVNIATNYITSNIPKHLFPTKNTTVHLRLR